MLLNKRRNREPLCALNTLDWEIRKDAGPTSTMIDLQLERKPVFE